MLGRCTAMEHESQFYGQAVGDFEVVADFKIQVFEKVQVQFVEVDDAVRRNLFEFIDNAAVPDAVAVSDVDFYRSHVFRPILIFGTYIPIKFVVSEVIS